MIEFYVSTPAEFRALLGCFLFAVNQILARRLTDLGSALTVTVLINLWMGLGGGLLSLASDAYAGDVFLGMLVFVVVGVVGAGMARYTGYYSNTLVGVSRTNAFIAASPLGSALAAVFLLGEEPGAAVWAGTGLIVFGLVFLVGEKGAGGIPARFYLFPLMSMLAYALTPYLRKVALLLLDAPWLGLSIASFSGGLSLVAVSPFLASRERLRLGGRMALLCLLPGLISLVSAFSFWTALRDGRLAVVTPLIRISPVFVMFLSYVFLRGREVFTARMVASVLIVVAGVVLVTSGG